MPYKPGAGCSFLLQMAKYLGRSCKTDPLVCGSVVYRYIPLGFMFSKSRRSWEILEPMETVCLSTRAMTSTWPSNTHFSPGVKYTHASKNQELGSSFLTQFLTSSFQICWTCKRWKEARARMTSSPYMPTQMQIFIEHSFKTCFLLLKLKFQHLMVTKNA